MPKTMLSYGVAALTLVGVLAGEAVLAEDHPPISDEVVFSLSQEKWVETDTAKIVLSIDATGEGGDAAAVRERMLQALDKVAPKADWRFTAFDRHMGSSGLENWSATVEARLKESALDGIATAAKTESRPGLQIRISTIDFSPQLSDYETARMALRKDIYDQVQKELEQLNQTLGDVDEAGNYRIGKIDFTDSVMPGRSVRPAARMMTMDAAASGAFESGIHVANRANMSATVVLTRAIETKRD